MDERRREAFFTLQEASGLLQMLMEHQLQRDGGLSYLQFSVLARLSHAPESRMRMTDLADAIIHSRSGLSYQTRKLEQAGLLERHRNLDDERSVAVVLTEAGRRLLAQVMPGHVAVVERGMFEALDDEQAEALVDILGAVRDRLREVSPTSSERRRGATTARPA